MDDELRRVAAELQSADSPEDVFGTLKGTVDERLKSSRLLFSRMLRVINPHMIDKDSEEKLTAEEAFRQLHSLWKEAQEKIKNGTYGTVEPIVVTTRLHEYRVVRKPLASGDITHVHLCSFIDQEKTVSGTFKVATDPRDNDLVLNEAQTLRRIAAHRKYTDFRPFVPRLIESMNYRDPASPGDRQANVLAYHEAIASPVDLYNLQQIREWYPAGVDPRDMAWMYRKILFGLGNTHACDVIHGAVLPTHILVYSKPEDHGIVLIDWSYAVHEPDSSGERISAISKEYKAWYPKEVFNKQTPTPAFDLVMATRCMVYVLGGDPLTGDMPTAVPPTIREFFQQSIRKGVKGGIGDAKQLYGDFSERMDTLWKRKFRYFPLPPK